MLTALGVTGAAEDPLLDIVISNVQYRFKTKPTERICLKVGERGRLYGGWRIPEHEEGFRAVGRV